MSIDNMNEAELNTALQSEIQSLNGGISPNNNEFQEEDNQDNSQDEFEDNQEETQD